MRTQAATYFQPGALSNIEIFFRVLLPAFLIRPSLGDITQSLIHKGPINSICPLRQFKCANDRCVQIAWMCDGEDDCGDNSDETAPQCMDPQPCKDFEFTCRSGFCIPKEYHCDKERDCADGSDEDPELCAQGKCDADHFQCGPGHCIPKSWICDGKPDCKDGLDEANCNKTCSSSEFTCGDGSCVEQSFVCDGDDDCDDGSDEKDCVIPACTGSDFQCDVKKCVPQKWLCDGDYDCEDHTDEMNCSRKDSKHAVCSPNEFACPDHLHCVKSFMLCDGEQDCPDGGDESPDVCPNVTCSDTQYRCRNHQCIDRQKRCNGENDCSDGSDEDDCLNSCKRDEFNCGEGICIPMSKVCDKTLDCPFGEDEPRGKCGVNECIINNGGCSDICVDTVTGHHCKCRPGYKLINNYTCVDINECENPGSCSQICVNKKGSFTCECMNGYDVSPLDPHQCVANSSHQASLIFTRRHDIRQISLDGKNMSTIIDGTNSSTALDFLYEGETIFWSDAAESKIYKAPIYAGMSRSVVISNISLCEGLAVDWIYHNIYWTDTGKKTIEVANLEGTARKTLISTNLGEPRAIVVNPLDGWMYWTDWGNDGRIERAGLDGSNRRKIVSYEVRWPNGLTLDLVRNRLYWIDAKTNMISSVNFDGTGRSRVLRSETELHHPFSVSVFEDTVYWTDWDSQTIFQANKFNGSNASKITPTRMLQNPMVVQVYHPYRQPGGVNHCEHMSCSHLCLPVPSTNSYSPKVTCACPDDMVLHTDGKACYGKFSGPATEGTPDETTLMTEDPVIIDNDRALGIGVSFYVIIGIVILFLTIPFSFVAYKYYKSKTINRITFDPPYHIPSDDKLIQVKKPFSHHIMGPYDEGEPLRRPGTNSFV